MTYCVPVKNRAFDVTEANICLSFWEAPMNFKELIPINRFQVHEKRKLIIFLFACLNFDTFGALVMNPYEETMVNVLI